MKTIYHSEVDSFKSEDEDEVRRHEAVVSKRPDIEKFVEHQYANMTDKGRSQRVNEILAWERWSVDMPADNVTEIGAA